jgi:CheY-like chemotaxis protein
MNDPLPTILIVEDEEPIRTLLRRILAQQRYRIIEATSGDQALELLAGHAVDLILLDLHMPGQVDGEELLFQLRDRGDEVPIIVVSGWVDDEATIHRPDCVHAVLKKPIQSHLLLDTVRQALT